MIFGYETRGVTISDDIQFPEIHEIVGLHPGPTLTILGGVHGDELEGVLAARRLAGRVDPRNLCGTLRSVAPAHPAAWARVTRSSPLDGLNLARVFPGDAHGSPTEKIAHFLTTQAIEGSDFLIDLHSAGEGFDMPLMVGYHDGGDALAQRAALAAEAFGAPYIWLHPNVSPGRSLDAAESRGIPSIYVEGRGGGQVQLQDLDCYVDGVERVMQSLGMVDQAPTACPSITISGDGDTDAGIVSPASGYFVNAVAVGDEIEAGELIGKILDEQGATLARITAPRAGIVMLLRRRARVRTDETAAIIAGRVNRPTAPIAKGSHDH